MKTHGQLQLSIHSEHEEGSLRCRGIFTLGYLRRHFTTKGLSEEALCALHKNAKARWEKNRIGLERGSEMYLRSQYLDWLLRELGWYYIPEQKFPAGLTVKRPDYSLFLNEDAQLRAVEQSNPVDVLRECATVVEAKRFGHALDKASDRDTPGLFPSQQIQDYLRRASDATGQRFFNWAVLTNGAQWRLYCQQAPPDAFFAFQLIDDGQFCSLDEFRLFVALFSPAAFEPHDGRCRLDDLRENSLTLQSDLELNLRKRIFDVLEELATAFWKNPDNKIAEADFAALYDNALIFLYRLLFILYAESRDLLPAKSSGAGANKTYREKFSLARLVATLRNKNEYPSDDFDALYEDLRKLFHLINGDRPAQNKACNVTRYNGGLFNPKQHPKIEDWRIGDKSLADVLRQIIFSQPPARASVRQQEITTEEAIDYSTLEVRQLGDIYEGLLGAVLREQTGRLVLVNQNGENHRHGIFYTPDWIVRYLLRESLQPLINEIDSSREVQAASKAKSEEKRRDNSFAHAVLRLNLVDPAMGSGHFLVRATEWLAEQILYHPTTRLMTEQIAAQGERRRSREDILNAGRIPISPGISQEQAETAYWRRRVVEACIYGVDINPMAVELAKLSLWLTCIAVDEPLNFLDHHLRGGNSLLFASPDELSHPPVIANEDEKQVTFDIGDRLTQTLRDVIAANVNIEEEASTEMEVVKNKEERWKNVRGQLSPLLKVADMWLAALDGAPVSVLQYRDLALLEIAPGELKGEEAARAKKTNKSLADLLSGKQQALNPFHWHLEFPDVFFQPNGQPRPDGERGFDALLGNPPYISTHTSSAETWRNALEHRAGYLEDLYVHFTDLGFQLLRPGGAFGFIVSDTFFTLASKLRMRELLQTHQLTHLGQCDPFDATVDAAIFVARKVGQASSLPDSPLLFIQARPRKTADGKPTAPDRALPKLSDAKLTFDAGGHAAFDCLRVHRVAPALYRNAHKQVFFEPRPATVKLYERFNEPVSHLVAEWWERIETSQKFADNLDDLRAYHATLKPGDITLVGLIAEGGQGLATANNARFLAFLEGTDQARNILAKRERWTQQWLAHPKFGPVFRELLQQHGGNPAHPTANSAAWEACIEPLKGKFKLADLDFTKSDLYRIAPKELIATDADFQFAWQQRKAELLNLWQNSPDLQDFWQEGDWLKAHPSAKPVTDADFCALCQQLQQWVEHQRKDGRKISRDALGLRSSETYTDPADAPRIATIYNGLSGRGQFVAFRKGDPEGNRWLENEPLYIEWSPPNVKWLFENSGKKAAQMPVMRNPEFFFQAGVSWTRGANHVPIKAKMVIPSVMDVNAMKLSAMPTSKLSADFLLAVFNSDVFSFFLKKFIAHTWMVQISDIRMMPLTIPTKAQADRLTELGQLATAAKRLTFTNAAPGNELVAALRDLTKELSTGAPAYLRPDAQSQLLASPAACLAVIERAVNWEAEKLYDVEGEGPFDEF